MYSLSRALNILVAVTGLLLSAGCQKPMHFPAASDDLAARAVAADGAYDTNSDGKADFFAFADDTGRIVRIAYDQTGDGRPDETIRLDDIPFNQCRHLVIILDGLSHELVQTYYQDGKLQMFHPPSRVVSPYPSMTDTSIQDLLGEERARAFEALYYDRANNRLAGGSSDYLAGVNASYNNRVDYRASGLMDALGYIDPWAVFGKEVNDTKRAFDRIESKEIIAYLVSSAGMGTKFGAEGQIRCLQLVERLASQVIWESRGKTKVTIVGDHGHSNTPSERIDFAKILRAKGWRPTQSLKTPEDVVCIEFGLVHFASFAALRPAELAEDIANCEGVELVSYADKDAIVVLGPHRQRAIIRRNGDKYVYEAVAGDPLKLGDVLAGLGGGNDGYHTADALLAATVDHVYPAPLQRLWRAHFGLSANAPDVIASLANGYYAGKASMARSVKVASTHGSLRRDNSVTFIMSTVGVLADPIRSRDVPAAMSELVGADWPLKK